VKHSQRGSIIIGIIIGVVLGLAAALAVAVYVTKVPVPFLNKGQSRTAEQDAAEVRKNRDWDPNAPLYGKNPAKPLAPAPAVIAPPPVAAVPPAAPASEKAALAVKPPPPAKAPSADPLGDLAAARTAVVGGDPFLYFVQAGAYARPEDAEQQRAKLAMMGLAAKITEREQAGRTMYRVRVGPFDKKEDADAAKEKLDGSGIESALVRVQR